jgi:hypothetical protein
MYVLQEFDFYNSVLNLYRMPLGILCTAVWHMLFLILRYILLCNVFHFSSVVYICSVPGRDESIKLPGGHTFKLIYV